MNSPPGEADPIHHPHKDKIMKKAIAMSKKRPVIGKAPKRGKLTGLADFTQQGLKQVLPGGAHRLIDLGRQAFRDLTGFAERDVYAGSGRGESGGDVVVTQDAPVAFPRRPIGVTARHYSVDGRDFVHVHDLSQIVQTGASTSFVIGTSQGVYPLNTSLFPNTSYIGENWCRWKCLKLAFHYTHFAPTSQQAAVELVWDPDAAYGANLSPATTSAIMSYENSVMGSCYEDFSLEVNPEAVKQQGTGPQGWMYTFSGTGSYDTNLTNCGWVWCATDQNVAADESTKVGFLWTEGVFEFRDFKSQNVSGLSIPRIINSVTTTDDDDEAERVIATAARRLVDGLRDRRRRTKTGASKVTALSAAGLDVPSDLGDVCAPEALKASSIPSLAATKGLLKK